MFEKAIQLDADYAFAYAGLADVHSWLYEWEGGKKADLERAESNSQKALALHPIWRKAILRADMYFFSVTDMKKRSGI